MPDGNGQKASDLFIQCLEEEGCEYIFGVPGEENLDFLASLSRSTRIKLILTRHEQGAGFMAATYGRHTGNPDFVEHAESYGARGYRVESSAHLKELLEHCNATPGVHLIECSVDYSENDQILNKDIKELSQAL
jgi:thiamine pyrophosphate-dependent acetolactate synthase large subunit-like protein